MAKFPTELTERIIDFLYPDKDALTACSLVCKSWNPASRYHLFQELILTPAKARTLFDLFGSTTPKNDISVDRHPSSITSNVILYAQRVSLVKLTVIMLDLHFTYICYPGTAVKWVTVS
jgi:hypothetical protein